MWPRPSPCQPGLQGRLASSLGRWGRLADSQGSPLAPGLISSLLQPVPRDPGLTFPGPDMAQPQGSSLPSSDPPCPYNL